MSTAQYSEEELKRFLTSAGLAPPPGITCEQLLDILEADEPGIRKTLLDGFRSLSELNDEMIPDRPIQVPDKKVLEMMVREDYKILLMSATPMDTKIPSIADSLKLLTPQYFISPHSEI